MEIRNRRSFLLGVAVLVAGLVSLSGLVLFSPSPGPMSPFSFNPRGGGTSPASPGTTGTRAAPSEAYRVGERIYLYGIDVQGDPHPRSGMGMMTGSGCVQCHGQDGRGGTLRMMMGSVDVPDIRWSTLSSPHQDEGEQHPAFHVDSFSRAVREGVEPSGDRLNSIMPRWDLSDAQIEGLIEYLKAL